MGLFLFSSPSRRGFYEDFMGIALPFFNVFLKYNGIVLGFDLEFRRVYGGCSKSRSGK